MKRGTFTIGTATTHVTGPLDADGYIDYAAALNERLSQGVTPESNANVDIWNALGPNATIAAPPPEFFAMMGMPVPPVDGAYYVKLEHYFRPRPRFMPRRVWNGLKAALRRLLGSSARDSRLGGVIGAEIDMDALLGFGQRPWTVDDNPSLNRWLIQNERPLALVFEATTKSHYFNPIVREADAKNPSLKLVLGTDSLPQVAWAFATRAMRHLSQGNAAAAWQDLLACHRLGRLVAWGGSLFEVLVGLVIEQTACQGTLAFLAYGKPDAQSIETCLRDLHALLPLPNVADKIGRIERLWTLDMFMQVDRVGFSLLSGFWDLEKGQPVAHGFSDEFLNGIDWNPAMEVVNTSYDRIAAALRENDRATRNLLLAQIETEVLQLKSSFDKRAWVAFKNESVPPALRGQVVGYWSVSLSLTSFRKVAVVTERTLQIHDNVITALALEWYHRDNGRYPERLDELAPKYLKDIPCDRFSGQALIYRPGRDEYLLHSMGVTGTDARGRGPDAIQMPLRH